LNFEKQHWHQNIKMTIAQTAMPAVYCADNDLIYVAGGRTSSPNPSSVALSNAMYVYDIRSDTWNHLVNLPVAAIENVVMSITRW
jgi:N-acetylneuraminic acid mutarotase